jgi:hypothetical protein
MKTIKQKPQFVILTLVATLLALLIVTVALTKARMARSHSFRYRMPK